MKTRPARPAGPSTPPNPDAAPEKSRGKNKWMKNLGTIFSALVLALFIRAFVVEAYEIPSGSMKNTLLVGDRILVNKFIYGVKSPFFDHTLIKGQSPRRGDMVVFRFPKDPDVDFIKRVVALAGDVIEIKGKTVYVNGQIQDQPYARFVAQAPEKRKNFGPMRIPPGHLFVMGDNRDFSYDSRFWGLLDMRDVKGKAFMVLWSWDGDHFAPRLDRFGRFLDS